MDLIDGADIDSNIFEWVEKIEESRAKDKAKHGQLVQDHSQKSVVIKFSW
jgi:hypothetical protein